MNLTLDELQQAHKEQLDKLIAEAGGVNHLSKMLNLPYTTVKGWEDRGRISKSGASMVEEHGSLGEHYKAKDLRPDL